MRSLRARLALLIVAALVVAGCSSDDTITKATTTTAAKTTTTVPGQRTEGATSLAQLAKDATAVVIGTGGPSHEELVKNQPFTVTTVIIEESLKGTAKAGGTVDVRQPGTDQIVVGDRPTVMGQGRRYLMYLQPATDASAPDQFMVVKLAGIWELDADGQAQRLDPVSTELPTDVSATKLQSEVADSIKGK